MSDTEKARAELARQQAEGAHNPAKQCDTCNTWHSPGEAHTRNDTGGESRSNGLFSRRHG